MAYILIVEDEQWMADCYRQWLRTAGHTVGHARNAQSALDVIDTRLPDVILLDILLPYANGIQLLHTLRSHTDLVNIPVVVCSGSLPSDMPPLAPYGIHKVLNKAEISPQVLQRVVKEVLDNAIL